jgi:hypothetical protein
MAEGASATPRRRRIDVEGAHPSQPRRQVRRCLGDGGPTPSARAEGARGEMASPFSRGVSCRTVHLALQTGPGAVRGAWPRAGRHSSATTVAGLAGPSASVQGEARHGPRPCSARATCLNPVVGDSPPAPSAGAAAASCGTSGGPDQCKGRVAAVLEAGAARACVCDLVATGAVTRAGGPGRLPW